MVLPALLWAGPARAQAPVRAQYDMYAAGIDVAEVEAGIGIAPATYRMDIAYRTTGFAGFFFRGHQHSSVAGTWRDGFAVPQRFLGRGVWRGDARVTDIAYEAGRPVIRQLEPPNADEREPVPEALQTGSVDSLTALVDLMRMVARTGRCDMKVRTYDGRRATEVEARTVGEEMLEPSRRSAFSGKALRCDFSGRLLAGFKLGEDREKASKPLHGSAWMAVVVPGGSPVPVRMAFETRWFGDVTMYLTSAKPDPEVKVVGGR
jgi:hypothetical protein